jgi:taurine dioxygenase
MEVIASGKALGAEVRGVDLSQPWTAETLAFVQKAWRDNLVILFRNQTISDEHLLAMADALGGQQSTGSRAYWLEAGYTEKSGRVSALPGISIISNLDENGKPAMIHAGSGSQELLWHTDNSYVDSPPKGSILHALQVPVDGGGHTSFSNQYLAYERLPEATKAKIAGKHTKQDASRNTAGGARPTKKLPTTYAEVEGPVHPLVRLHPDSGRKALYLGRRYSVPSSHVLEMPNADGEALLDELWEAATQPDLAWTHSDWQAGDVLMWDNRCTMHARTEVDPTQVRVMHRTLVKGEKPILA